VNGEVVNGEVVNGEVVCEKKEGDDDDESSWTVIEKDLEEAEKENEMQIVGVNKTARQVMMLHLFFYYYC